MGKMIYEPKHGHKHDHPDFINLKEPAINSIWECECGETFKYRPYLIQTAFSHGRWKKHKPKALHPTRGIGMVNVPEDWEPPSAALVVGQTKPHKSVSPKVTPQVITTSAHLETKIIPRMVNHRTSGEYEVENRPQYRYATDWFDGTIEGDPNYQKFEVTIRRVNG